MKRIIRSQLRLLMCIAAAAQLGCATEGLEPVRGSQERGAEEEEVAAEQPVQDPSAMTARGDAALARLAALQVFEVGHISDPNPAEGPHCYNLPCSDEEMASQVERAEALADVVAAAVEAGPISLDASTTAAANDGDCSLVNADVEASLASLRDLHVVTVGGLAGGDASNCYCFSGGDPCVDAVVAKAGVLARVVDELGAVPSSPFATAQ